MKTKVCLNCGAELKQMEGSREKKYCNDICRASYHQKKNKGVEPKYVRYSTFKELKDKFDALVAGKEIKVADVNKQSPKVKNLIEEKPTTNYTAKKTQEEAPKGLSKSEMLRWFREH